MQATGRGLVKVLAMVTALAAAGPVMPVAGLEASARVPANQTANQTTNQTTSQTTRAAASAPRDLWTTANSERVTLHWMRPASVAATGYRIQRRRVGGAWQTVVRNTQTSATTRVLRNLTNGTSYQFRVAAISDGSLGRWSAPSQRVVPAPWLRSGRSGEAVVALQDALMMRDASLDRDGMFGPATEAAVRSWQTTMSLPVTGVVDPATAASLGLGSNPRPTRGTDDQVGAALVSYLGAENAGRHLAADARLALRSFRYRTAGAGIPWQFVSTSPVGDWARLWRVSGQDMQGSGPVVIVDICFTTSSPRRFCGVMGAYADA